MPTIEIEIACDTHEAAIALTERVLNGDHRIGRKHGKWFWFCTCKPEEILYLSQELHYELT